MSKVIAASMVFVLVVGSGAFAQIILPDLGGGISNIQMTQIGALNTVQLMHGSQDAQTMQNFVINNAQCGTGICCSNAEQHFLGAIGEQASACGNCALIGVNQGIDVSGLQGQAIAEGCGPKVQLQSLALDAEQTATRADGQGGADAFHSIVLDSGQSGNNPAGHLSESSTVMGVQTSSVYGAAGSTGGVGSSMSVCTTQSQVAQ